MTPHIGISRKQPADNPLIYCQSLFRQTEPPLNIQMSIANVQVLYDLPQTARQLALLVSHDANRMVASLSWIKGVVESLKPASVFEVGCGGGYLLDYLSTIDTSITFGGIDRQKNFIQIWKEARQSIEIKCGDVFSTEPSVHYDLIICDFGWDNHDIPPSTSPHSTEELAGHPFCPGCSNDFIPHYKEMLSAWKGWGRPEAKLVVTGRLMNISELRAFLLAAELLGWHLNREHSGVIQSQNLFGDREKFPALVLCAERQGDVSGDIDYMVETYVRA